MFFCAFPNTTQSFGKGVFFILKSVSINTNMLWSCRQRRTMPNALNVQCTPTTHGVRNETLVTYLLASNSPHLLSCCCMNIVYPETGRLWVLLQTSFLLEYLDLS